jgi:hypothetical protein
MALVQLQFIGKQDAYLSGLPGSSYVPFKQVYHKATNFSMESIEQDTNATPTYGSKVQCTLGRYGDLLTGLTLELKLKRGTGDTFYCAERFVKDIEVYFGDIKVDSLTNTFMRMYDELYRTVDAREAYKQMTDFADEPEGTVKRFFLPIPLWFTEQSLAARGSTHPSGATPLPLVAMPYTEVTIHITFEESVPGIDTTYTPVVRIWGDYVFLEPEIRKQMVYGDHDFLIEQTQVVRERIEVASVEKSSHVDLPFNHPVKYLAWVMKPSQEAHGTFTAGGNGLVADEVFGPLKRCGLQINGRDRIAPRVGSYFRLQHPWTTFGQAPSVGVYVYSFAQHPWLRQPTGTLNTSTVDNLRLRLTTKAATLASSSVASTEDETVTSSANLTTIEVYARNYNVLHVKDGMAGIRFMT